LFGLSSFGFCGTDPETTAIRAFSALANGGVPVTPHIVTHIRYPEGTSKELKPEPLPRALSSESVTTISRMLTHVYDQGVLPGRKKNLPWSIAAKSGTAQLVKESGGGYYDDRYLHSFMGYFPAYDPQFIVLLFLVDPEGVTYSGSTVAYTFYDTAKFLLTYYQIPPDREPPGINP